MLRTGGAILVIALVVAAGGALAAAAGVVTFDDGATGEPTPADTPAQSTITPTPAATPTPAETDVPATPTKEPTPAPTPTPTATPTDGVDRPTEVSILVYVENESDHIDAGQLTIYDETGTAVGSHDLDDRPAGTFENLEPGNNYTAEVTAAGIGNIWPDQRVTFDPGEVDQLDIDVHFEFRGVDSYRYEIRHYRPNETSESNARWYAWGKVADGDAYAVSTTYSNLEFPRFAPGEYLAIDGQLFIGSLDSQWRKSEYFAYSPLRMPEHMLVQESLSVVSNRTERTFVGTRVLNDSTVYENLTEQFHDEYDDWEKTNHTTLPPDLNGTEAYVFELTFEGYSEYTETEYNYTTARVYVDPKTGRILRWQSSEILYTDGMRYGHHVVLDIYDVNETTVDPSDYEVPERIVRRTSCYPGFPPPPSSPSSTVML